MNVEENAQDQGGGEALPATQPRNDAEAAQLAQSTQQEADKAEEAKNQAAKGEEDKRRNRTTQYIDRLRNEARSATEREQAVLKRLEAIESRFPKQEPKQPTMADVNYDAEELARQTARYEVQKARDEWDAQQKSETAARSEQEKLNAYGARAQAFAAVEPDFEEVVGSIPPQYLSVELQRAIMTHEKGPEIAYKLALNEDELFQLASVRPELMEAAVARYASRLEAAPSPDEQIPLAPPALAPPQSSKPVTQAPPPAPRVGGRSPSETPPEKLTDEQWFAKRQEARRKR